MKKTLLISSLLLAAISGGASAQIIAAGDIFAGNSSNSGTGVLGENFSSISVPDSSNGSFTLAPTEIGISGVSISGVYRSSQDENDFGNSYPAPYQADLSGYNGTGDGSPLNLTLSGLTPNTSYNVLVYADENSGVNNAVLFTGDPTAYKLSGAYYGTGQSGSATPLLGDNYIEATEKANGLGDISFGFTSDNNYTDFNAVTVQTAPEPSTYTLIGLGAAAFLFVARLRTRRI